MFIKQTLGYWVFSEQSLMIELAGSNCWATSRDPSIIPRWLVSHLRGSQILRKGCHRFETQSCQDFYNVGLELHCSVLFKEIIH